MLAKMGSLLRPSLLAALLLGGLGIVFAVGGVRLGLWVDDAPGPGLIPSISAILLLLLLLPTYRERAGEEELVRWEPLLAVALGGLFVVLAPRVGIVIPAVAMLTLWVKFLHGQSWLRAALLGVSLTAVGMLVFHVVLKVPMPLFPGAL